MILATALIQFLMSIKPLTAIVSDRIGGIRSPMGGAMPRVNVEVTQNQRMPVLRGQTALVDAKVRISFTAATQDQAYELAEIVRTSGLDGFKGTRIGWDGLNMQHVLLDDEAISDDPSPGTESQSSFTIAQDYGVMYRESPPAPAPAFAAN